MSTARSKRRRSIAGRYLRNFVMAELGENNHRRPVNEKIYHGGSSGVAWRRGVKLIGSAAARNMLSWRRESGNMTKAAGGPVDGSWKHT